jgi:AmmeMemoRadiSam system protein A
MEHQDELFTDVSKAELLNLVRGILKQCFEDPMSHRFHRANNSTKPHGTDPTAKVRGPFSSPHVTNYQSLSQATKAILDLPMGVFVTLKIGGTLRGCIGQFTSSKPLGTILPQVTGVAAFRDPRFKPLTFNELPEIRLSLSLLSPDKPIPSWQEIKLGQQGIILEAHGRRSVFLPEVPIEQGWNLETTLSALSTKAGLAPQVWQQPDAKFRVFTSVYVSEDSGGPS